MSSPTTEQGFPQDPAQQFGQTFDAPPVSAPPPQASAPAAPPEPQQAPAAPAQAPAEPAPVPRPAPVEPPAGLGNPEPPRTPAPPSSPSMTSGETERLDPEPTDLTLPESGLRVKIQPLKMRQLFRLLRIVTRGGAQYLPMLREALMGITQGGDEDATAFGTQLIAVAVIALPEAEDEAVDFIMSVCEPHGIKPGNDNATNKANEKLRRELGEALFNPEMEDMISIIERVIMIEKDDLMALGKRLGQTFKVMTKVDPDAKAATENLQASTTPTAS